VYDYTKIVQRTSEEISRLRGVDTIAAHVLSRLVGTLDLGWAGIALTEHESTQMFHCGDAPDEAQLTRLVQSETPVSDQGGTLPLVSENTVVGHLLIGPKQHESLSPGRTPRC
jgi:hypothetical protein